MRGKPVQSCGLAPRGAGRRSVALPVRCGGASTGPVCVRQGDIRAGPVLGTDPGVLLDLAAAVLRPAGVVSGPARIRPP
ncbi:hypothetical protein [Streptomyces yaizuensis]|uniref:Uncharacterized protein n=1 Tax=Streptomyces yaizuensis TaxID=2989713 RepID=A0AA86IVK7_9ACTN|nr:hypothetical protein [Streptomyces sp. YSPA8]BDT39691.1 hypothetical protein SYYSPA8_37865 [Streptomyces sp. YSPA8]